MASALKALTIRYPGLKGLNLERPMSDSEEDINFCRVANNVAFDSYGRVSARKGFTKYTTTALTGSPDISQVFMYDYASANIPIITATVSGSKKLYDATTSVTTYDTMTDRTGTAAPTANNWQFMNYNGSCVGVQQGHTPIVKTGTGNWALMVAASGSNPQGNAGCSAFGRLWFASGDKLSFRASGLLNYHWSTDSTEFNILGNKSSARTGYDEIVAIQPFDDKIVVFLQNSIVVFSGPDVPNTMTIYTIIEGIGCIARDSVQNIGTDIIFLSQSGLMLLSRALQYDNFPMKEVSHNVRKTLLNAVTDTGVNLVRSVFNPHEGHYLLLTNPTAWCVDLKNVSETEGGIGFRITTFDIPKWNALYYHEGTTYIGTEGKFGYYYDYLDEGASYPIEWYTVWNDIGTTRLKILKKINIVVSGIAAQTFELKWFTDYNVSGNSASVTIPTQSPGAEWGEAEFNLSEFGAGFTLANLKSNSSQTGEVISFGFTATVNGFQTYLEQMSLFVKIGREGR